ncbi:MAG: SLC13 family permease [Candidatus Hodarchaeales archaeon]|jgi:Na+/H+ antiporter NhaD/arsenite permease-like protein
MSEPIPDVPLYLIAVFIGIFIVTYALIIYSKFNKHFAAFLGGVLVLITAWLTRFVEGDPLFTDEVMVEALTDDLIILAIIVGNLIVVDVGSKSGLFHFISIKILKLTKGDPSRLMLYMGILCVTLSVVVNNISAILISSSLTILACQKLEINPYSYIMGQMILVNVGGLYTLVSSVPNIIIGTTLEKELDFPGYFGYFEFIQVGFIVATIIVFVTFISFRFLLPTPESVVSKEERQKIVDEFDEWAAVTDKNFFILTALVLTAMIFLFIISSFIGLSVVEISLAGAVAILLVSGEDFDKAIEAVDWPLLSFFAGLFVVVTSLKLIGAIKMLADFLQSIVGTNLIIAAIVILIASAFLSGIVDNIVIAAALTPVILTISEATGMSVLVLGWALIIGANLGGTFTPIGGPSNVIGISILAKRTGQKIGWGDWKIPAIVTLIQIVIGLFLITLMAILLG